MNILLVGYGKMGREIEKIAQERGHVIVGKITSKNHTTLTDYTKENTDVAIEFSTPEIGFSNITTLLKNNIPTVSGTTGWLDRWEDVSAITNKTNGAFFYASNFSVGVNIFFKVNEYLASIMKKFGEYDVKMTEIHHIHKLDAPSGTAITLAEDIMKHDTKKTSWALDESEKSSDLVITAVRENEVPGTHIIDYFSSIDSLEIKHEAHNRKGFALGAVLAAEFTAQNKGMLGMNDMLKL